MSTIRWTHSSWTAFKGTSAEDNAATTLITWAATITVSWILLYMHRPHLSIVTTETKLPSSMTMSELSFATSVPWIPMERPMSASLKAGASFVLSPVTATTSPLCFRVCTIRSLSKGKDRAVTRILSTAAKLSPGEKFRNSTPSTIISSILELSLGVSRMPHSMAIALAVWTSSPVIILKFTPSFLHDSTADLTSRWHGYFKVRAPILSVQMVVADPVVSQAESFRTMAILSDTIRFFA
ncbi:hypothetical protein CDL15_Pgr001607 [Punica granatum]|uniref:Uncharacterized protein n=1 Tax=Punica granatum TaxID=22663 RepID=A0A218XAR3_PUNGR|nr:hypothetical protein CDL15_Pgr001607 [Punica granatum]